MAEEIQEQEVQKEEVSRNELIDQVVERIREDKFTVHFYCPAMSTPSGGVGVLLRLASHLSERYNVNVWYEPQHNLKLSQQEYAKTKKKVDIFNTFNADWVDFDLSKIQFKALGDKEANIINSEGKVVAIETTPLQVQSEDFMFIPEGFPNIMQMTAQVSCKRIVNAGWSELAKLRN